MILDSEKPKTPFIHQRPGEHFHDYHLRLSDAHTDWVKDLGALKALDCHKCIRDLKKKNKKPKGIISYSIINVFLKSKMI